MSIFIKTLLNNKFEITIRNKFITKHTVILTDEYHDALTKKEQEYTYGKYCICNNTFAYIVIEGIFICCL